MLKGLRTNPLLQHIISQTKKPSLRFTLVMVLVLAVAGLAGGLVMLPNSQTDWQKTALWIIAQGGVIYTVVLSVVALIVAYRITRKYSQDASYKLIQLTPLSNMAMVQALAFGTLYRLRVLLGIAMGLVPVILLGVYAEVRNAVYPQSTPYSSIEEPCYKLIPYDEDLVFSRYLPEKQFQKISSACIEPDNPNLLWKTLPHTLWLIGYWEWILAAAALGVGLGFRRRSVFIGGLLISWVVLSRILTYSRRFFRGIWLLIDVYEQGIHARCPLPFSRECIVDYGVGVWPEPVLPMVARVVLPYLTAAGFMWLIQLRME